MNTCDFGCGKERVYFFKSSKKWCCSKSPNSCNGKRNADSLKKKGKNPFEGKEHPRGMKGKSPWNKGKVGLQVGWNKGILGSTSGRASTPEKELLRKQKISALAKLNNGGYRQGSGRGKKGWYKEFFCASSWELAYVVYCLEHGINIKRNTEKRQYMWDGVIKNYIPDFIVEGTIIEIKGFKTAQWLAKLEANPDIKVLYEKDLEPILEYVKNKYGENFINLYE